MFGEEDTFTTTGAKQLLDGIKGSRSKVRSWSTGRTSGVYGRRVGTRVEQKRDGEGAGEDIRCGERTSGATHRIQ